MGLWKTVAVGAIGYVLGARAGRARYESIKSNAQRVWDSSIVRDGRSKVRNQAAETFQQAQGLASAKLHEAADVVKDKVRGEDEADEIRVEAVRVDTDKTE
ncbi:hypothetical protein [Trueperella pecoris]|uniref:Protoporphyrinogen oxidase n=1 Tax=Trueperella pecoris TaxID=2733571 RepID=A0A7M1QUB3_9ACTO|nr:hypothetical protein [Trueperella pecoris]QOQ39641.1 hypothetical protein HLG82_09445 [Trueperella pecoris]QOR45732.1 hypothetical protein INS88_00385 [Trueperella pecoris]QTG75573.1 hypothetical protein J4179_00385 [Trueperella pecoris]